MQAPQFSIFLENSRMPNELIIHSLLTLHDTFSRAGHACHRAADFTCYDARRMSNFKFSLLLLIISAEKVYLDELSRPLVTDHLSARTAKKAAFYHSRLFIAIGDTSGASFNENRMPGCHATSFTQATFHFIYSRPRHFIDAEISRTSFGFRHWHHIAIIGH
jgi:hypothetical protein